VRGSLEEAILATSMSEISGAAEDVVAPNEPEKEEHKKHRKQESKLRRFLALQVSKKAFL